MINAPSKAALIADTAAAPAAAASADTKPDVPAKVDAKAPAALTAAQVVADHPAEPDKEGKLPFLTLRKSDTFGPDGWFADLEPGDALQHLKGDRPMLAIPTDRQLARRRR